MNKPKMQLREEFGKLDIKGIALLLVIAVVLGAIYSFFVGSAVLAFAAMIIAVFGTYFIISSFFEEERPVELLPGEKMILRTLDRGYVRFPQKKGGFLTKDSKTDLNIYLTSRRIIAMTGRGEKAIDQPLDSLIDVIPEKKVLTRYIRVRYIDKSKEKDALLFVGNVDLWIQRLGELGVRTSEDYGSFAEDGKKDEFIEDASTLRKKVEKRK